MRISDLLLETDVKTEITNDLMDFVTAYRQKNHREISMHGNNGAVMYLRKLGYNVNPNELMNLLGQPPFTEIVEKSTPDRIILKSLTPEINPAAKHKEQAKDKVKKTAAKVATKAVKTGDKL